jgi:hypothetical protein
VSPNLLIGALASFDDAQQDLTGLASKARSTGWMVGPYATMRLANNLFFQARAAWGKSTHELGLEGSPEDRFDADRWLVRGTLIGQWRWGPWQFRPRISVGYIEELQEAYQSTLGVAVPEQKVALGQVKGGPEISYRHKLADGTSQVCCWRASGTSRRMRAWVPSMILPLEKISALGSKPALWSTCGAG